MLTDKDQINFKQFNVKVFILLILPIKMSLKIGLMLIPSTFNVIYLLNLKIKKIKETKIAF
jgi:hypothetical protein